MPTPTGSGRLVAAVAATAASGLLLYYVARVEARRRQKAAVRVRLAEIMANRVLLPRGTLASETDDELLCLPAVLGETERLLLGDLGTVCNLLEGDGSERFRAHLAVHPITSVLVCMGSDAAASVSREFVRKGIVYDGLEGCADEEGYPLLEIHWAKARDFIRAQLDAAAAAGGCVLVHCHEGKNRSAALCTAYLVGEERMPLTEAVAHIWRQRPMVLDNSSFIEQLLDFSESRGLLA